MRLVNQECNAQLFEPRVLPPTSSKYPRKLLLCGNNDRTPRRDKLFKLLRAPRDAATPARWVKFSISSLDVLVERFPIREYEHHVHKLFAGARLKEAVKSIGKPTNRKCLA